MIGTPKKKRIKLTKKEYHELRLFVWKRCKAHCEICGVYMFFREMSLHHKKSVGAGGDDVADNVIGCHVVGCHPD
jgi:hypothetical protein